jgi:hypothetical protein
MTSQATKAPTREEESRLSIRTLVIASIASAVAAIVTSQIWVRGTPIAAALTPVIVTLVSEMLHRPTAVVARRMTAERSAVIDPDAPVRELEEETEQPTAPVRVYRSAEKPSGRRIHWKVVAVTGVLAFAIAAAALTLPELIAGQSIGKGTGKSSIFSPGKNKDEKDSQSQPQETTEEPAPEEEQEEPQQTTPEEQPAPLEEPTPTTEQPTPTTTTPAAPQLAPPEEP